MAQDRHPRQNGVTVPYKTITEEKMMLLYPTKSPRRQKWCYCTLQNRRGGKNSATVPYKTIAEEKMVLLYPTKSLSEAKMVLLYPTKPSRRKKWYYCTLQNHRGGKRKRSLPRNGKAPLYVCASYFLTIRFFSGNTTVGRKVFASSKSICA